MRKYVWVIAFLMTSGASPAFGLDLMQVYEQALTSDPRLRAAKAERDSTREARPQALALLRPTISAGASVNHVELDVKKSASGANDAGYEKSEFSLSLAQPVYHRNYWIQLEQADLQIAQAEAEYAAAEQDLMIRTARAYFEVLSAQDTLEFARAEKAAIGRQLDQARQRFDVGLIAITAVHEAQAAFDKARADEIQAENAQDNAWESLHEIIGDSEKSLIPLAAKFPLHPPQPLDIDRWQQMALDQNLGLSALRYATEAIKENIEVQRSGHFPSLDLVGSHTLSRTTLSTGTESDTSIVGLQLTMPLYAGGGVSSRTKQARFDYEAAQDVLDQQRRSVIRQVRDAYRGVLSSISRVEALDAATISAQSALEATEAGFEVGTRTMVDVLDEQRDLYGARRDYARVRYDYMLNSLLLKQAAGALSEGDLKSVNALLQRKVANTLSSYRWQRRLSLAGASRPVE